MNVLTAYSCFPIAYEKGACVYIYIKKITPLIYISIFFNLVHKQGSKVINTYGVTGCRIIMKRIFSNDWEEKNVFGWTVDSDW